MVFFSLAVRKCEIFPRRLMCVTTWFPPVEQKVEAPREEEPFWRWDVLDITMTEELMSVFCFHTTDSVFAQHSKLLPAYAFPAVIVGNSSNCKSKETASFELLLLGSLSQ